MFQVGGGKKQASVVCDYTAVKDVEISASRGESVHILASSQDGMYLVHRGAAGDSCPAAEGWVPGYVIGMRSFDK